METLLTPSTSKWLACFIQKCAPCGFLTHEVNAVQRRGSIISLDVFCGSNSKIFFRTFTVGDERSNYQLAISGFSGTGGKIIPRFKY